jgi:two-component system, LuxR family, response regulator DctR
MSDGIIHVVDDDAAIRDSLCWLLRSRGLAAQHWESGEAFLGGFVPDSARCIVLDVRMEGMGGVEVFDELVARRCRVPVIFLTGHGDVPLAVAALKNGAFDFVEKPFNDNLLVDRIIEAMRVCELRVQEQTASDEVAVRLTLLTARERQIMERILAGELNKQIADALDIAIRTVEVHRARIFEKLGVRSAVELAGIVLKHKG